MLQIPPALDTKQQRAIQALLREATIDAAAKKAGVSRQSMWRWLQQPAFSEAYREARSRLLERTVTVLQSVSFEAVTVLVSVMNDPESTASTRVMAARSLLEFAIRSREHLELEDRIRALETGNHYGLRPSTFPS